MPRGAIQLFMLGAHVSAPCTKGSLQGCTSCHRLLRDEWSWARPQILHWMRAQLSLCIVYIG